MAFLQPALTVTVPRHGGWTKRATLGPIFSYTPQSSEMMPLWPNVEFSHAWPDGSELTLLGNSLVGWRTVF